MHIPTYLEGTMLKILFPTVSNRARFFRQFRNGRDDVLQRLKLNKKKNIIRIFSLLLDRGEERYNIIIVQG